MIGTVGSEIPLRAVIGPMVRIQGIAVGSRARFEAMNRAIALNNLKPVLASTFPLEKSVDAFRHMREGKHFGKIVIAL
ncbi:MAG: zinc-binding dehydrogenase [Burkholderiales bacterium]